MSERNAPIACGMIASKGQTKGPRRSEPRRRRLQGFAGPSRPGQPCNAGHPAPTMRHRPRNTGLREDQSDRRKRMEDKVAGAKGLEPSASAVTGQRSNQLSYAPAGDARALMGRRWQVKTALYAGLPNVETAGFAIRIMVSRTPNRLIRGRDWRFAKPLLQRGRADPWPQHLLGSRQHRRPSR